MTDQPQRPLTILDLDGLSLPGEMAVHPAGDRVAFALGVPDLERSEVRTQVHLAPSGAGERGDRALTYGLHDAVAPAWSPDGTSLAFVAFRPQPHEDEEDDRREDGGDKQQVFLLPSGGGEARRLTEAAEGIELFRWWPDGSGVAWLGPAPRPEAERAWRRRRTDDHDDPVVVGGDIPDMEIWFAPLEGRAKRLVGGVRGIEDFDVSPDGKLLAYATNHTGRTEDGNKVEIVLRELEHGTERRLTAGRGGAEATPCFTLDGRFLAFHGWADPQLLFSRQELFACDLLAPEAPPRPLLAAIDRDLEEFAPLPDGRLAALVAWGFESRLVLVDPRGGAAEVVPLEGRVLTALDVARDAGRIAVVAEDGTLPPEVGFVDPGRGTFEPLTDLHPQAAEWHRAPRRRIDWINDGLAHEGLLVLPLEPPRTPPPVLVWLHGGPHWRVLDTLRTYEAECFAARGWAVFMPQYRGSSGYGENYALALRGDLGGGDARDVLAGLDALAAAGLVDPARAAVGGASYGGYLASWLVATTPRFAAGISMCGIFDLAQDFSTAADHSWELHYLGGTPWERPELYRERSPLAHAASIGAPLLALHGLEDDNTLVTNSKALHRALLAQGKTSQLVVYPREGHGFAEPSHRIDAHRRIAAWIERHVLGAPGPLVTGQPVARDGMRLTLLGQRTPKDYSGMRPPVGRGFLELTLLLRADEGGPDYLRVCPAGASADVVLVDGDGDVLRPVGVALDVHGQSALFDARGALEACAGADGRPPALAFNCVFEVPDGPASYELRVLALPALALEVVPEPDDDEA